MRLGIMQPYFVPYIGYWQLLNAVDSYVIYDDVNYIKGGWVNRNRILVNGEAKYFNVPMIGASPNKLINEVGVNTDPKIIGKNKRFIEAAYIKAPFFTDAYPVVSEILQFGSNNLAEYLEHSILAICDYLDITTHIIISSNLEKDNSLRGQDKVLSICELLGATEYYNAIGGQELYSFDEFSKKGIALKFLKPGNVIYKQFGDIFVNYLSIVDIMMFNSKKTIKEMLNNYTLITE